MSRVWESSAWRHKRMVQERERLARQQTLPASEAGSVKEEAERRAREAALETDVLALNDLPEGETRNAKKRGLLNLYLPAVEAYLEESAIYSNPLLVRCMMWAFDADEIALAYRLANACMLQGQPMPQGIKRDLVTFVADELLGWSEKQITFNRSPEPYFSETMSTILGWNIPGMVKAKYCKFAAERAMEAELWDAADTFYNTALSYDHKIQIKTKHDKAKKMLKLSADPSTPDA